MKPFGFLTLPASLLDLPSTIAVLSRTHSAESWWHRNLELARKGEIVSLRSATGDRRGVKSETTKLQQRGS